MSKFDHASLKNLEKLCRIQCSPKEEANFIESLNQILDYVELLSEVDTSQVSNRSHILKDIATPYLREDKVEKTLTREEFLENAPQKIGGMIQVPLIIKSE